MAHFNITEINQLERFYKINLINCISGYKSANLIATKSKTEVENVAVFSSVVHLGSEPPLLGLVLRPKTKTSSTYDNIKETGCFTINHIHKSIIEDAHHTSAKYPVDSSEFDFTSLESEHKNEFFAPYVKESPVQIGLKYQEEHYVKSNDTIILIGEIQHLYIKDELLENDGFVNLLKGEVAAISGLYGYSVPTSVQQLPYQRPKK